MPIELDFSLSFNLGIVIDGRRPGPGERPSLLVAAAGVRADMWGAGQRGWSEEQPGGEVCRDGRGRRGGGGELGRGAEEVLIWDVTVTISAEARLAAISIFAFPFFSFLLFFTSATFHTL